MCEAMLGRLAARCAALRACMLLSVLACALLVTTAADARPRLLVLQAEEQPPRPSLVEALRFQLRDATDVEASPAPFALGPPAVRIGRAAEVAGAAQARFAVWLESVPELQGVPGFLLYVVGGSSGRAVVEVVRMPAANDGPDVDRSLALKVSEIVDSALGADEALSGAALRAAPLPAVLDAPAKRAPAARSNEAALGVLLGGVLSSPAGSANGQVGGRLGVVYSAPVSELELELGVSGRLLSPLTMRNAEGRVKVSEEAASIELCVRSRGKVQLGAELEASLHWLHADGFWQGAETGSADLIVPALRLGPELRFRLGEQTKLALGAGGSWTPVRERFSLGRAPVADLGRFRADALISLIISIR